MPTPKKTLDQRINDADAFGHALAYTLRGVLSELPAPSDQPRGDWTPEQIRERVAVARFVVVVLDNDDLTQPSLIGPKCFAAISTAQQRGVEHFVLTPFMRHGVIADVDGDAEAEIIQQG